MLPRAGFFLVGEPGIGKTRLAEEMAGVAGGRGIRTLWGRAWAAEGVPPYWPWVQILRGLVEGKDPVQLRLRIGPGLRYVLQLLPELKRLLPDAPESAGHAETSLEAPARQRFHLFDAVARLVMNLTADRPHLFVLDDLQWADLPSLLLLHFLAREIRAAPVLVLGIYRDVEARSEKQVAEILASLEREGRVVHLRGLSEPEVARLVSARNRGRTSEELTATVYRMTEGNPFFVDGILRLLASGPPGGGGKRRILPIPSAVRETVRHRLGPLPEKVRELLAIAAMLGREFEQAALVAASGSDSEWVVSALEAAREIAVLTGTKSPHRWRFAHDLFREVLCGDLPPTARMRLHEHVGSALESFYGEDAEDHAAELAAHFFSALPVGDAGKVLRYGTLAARQAMASWAWEDAVVELERALVALGSNAAASDHDRLKLLLDLGRAIWRSEDPERFREVFGEAIGLARKLSLPRDLARAVIGFVGPWDTTGVVDEAKVELVEEALSALGESDPVLRGQLLVQLAWLTYYSPARDRRNTAEECVRAAREAGEPALLAQALRLRRSALWGSPSDLPERLAVSDEMLDAARRTGDQETILAAQLTRIFDLFETVTSPVSTRRSPRTPVAPARSTSRRTSVS